MNVARLVFIVCCNILATMLCSQAQTSDTVVAPKLPHVIEHDTSIRGAMRIVAKASHGNDGFDSSIDGKLIMIHKNDGTNVLFSKSIIQIYDFDHCLAAKNVNITDVYYCVAYRGTNQLMAFMMYEKIKEAIKKELLGTRDLQEVMGKNYLQFMTSDDPEPGKPRFLLQMEMNDSDGTPQYVGFSAKSR